MLGEVAQPTEPAPRHANPRTHPSPRTQGSTDPQPQETSALLRHWGTWASTCSRASPPRHQGPKLCRRPLCPPRPSCQDGSPWSQSWNRHPDARSVCALIPVPRARSSGSPAASLTLSTDSRARASGQAGFSRDKMTPEEPRSFNGWEGKAWA